MTKTELDMLVKLNRQRGKLVKQEIAAAAAHRKAQFEEQLATEYSFDADETWKAAVETAAHSHPGSSSADRPALPGFRYSQAVPPPILVPRAGTSAGRTE